MEESVSFLETRSGHKINYAPKHQQQTIRNKSSKEVGFTENTVKNLCQNTEKT